MPIHSSRAPRCPVMEALRKWGLGTLPPRPVSTRRGPRAFPALASWISA